MQIKADTNKSGAIDFEEFICWVSGVHLNRALIQL
jgi:hypothetical protein